MIYTVYPSNETQRVMRRDASGDAVISDSVGPSDNRSQFQLGRYNAPFWNATVAKTNNNCYSYACNIRVDNGFPDPGYRLYGEAVSNKQQLLNGIQNDGLVRIVDGEGATPVVHGSEMMPAWIVALFSGWGVDNAVFGYHFFRKVWSGRNDRESYWAHKFLDGFVTNKSAGSNNLITSPVDEMKKINKNNGIDYELEGYFLVKPDVTIGAPPLIG